MFVITIFLSIVYPSDYKSSKELLKTIDSLLLKGELVEVDKIVNSHNLNSQDSSDVFLIQKKVIQLSKLMENLSKEKDGVLNELITQYRKLSTYYSLKKAGDKALKSIDNFLECSNSNMKLKAIKHFKIAEFYKSRFQKRLFEQIRLEYKETFALYETKQYKKSLAKLNKIKKCPIKSLHFIQLCDSIRFLKKEIKNNLNEKKLYSHLWNRKLKKEYTLIIQLGGEIFCQPQMQKKNFDVESEYDFTEIEIKNIPTSYRHSLSIGLLYNLGTFFNIGTSFNKNRLQYSSKNDQKLLFYDFDINFNQIDVYLKYLLRPYVGLRPFINLGVGNLSYKRKKTEGFYMEFADDSTATYIKQKFILNEENNRTYFLLSEYGMEYIAQKNSRFSINLKCSVYYNFKENKYFKHFNYSFGLNLGFFI